MRILNSLTAIKKAVPDTRHIFCAFCQIFKVEFFKDLIV